MTTEWHTELLYNRAAEFARMSAAEAAWAVFFVAVIALGAAFATMGNELGARLRVPRRTSPGTRRPGSASPSDVQRSLGLLQGKVIGVAGPISVGKSTLCRAVKGLSAQAGTRCAVFFEKAHEDVIGTVLRDDASKKAYSGLFQNLMFSECRVKVATASQVAQQGFLSVVDRTVWDNHVFYEVNRDAGNIPREEDRHFYELMAGSIPELLGKCDYLVYMHAPARRCLERVFTRGDEAEKAYMLQYFEELEKRFGSKLLRELEAGNPNRIVVIDWSEFGAVEKVVSRVADAASGARILPGVDRWSVGDAEATQALCQEVNACASVVAAVAELSGRPGAGDSANPDELIMSSPSAKKGYFWVPDPAGPKKAARHRDTEEGAAQIDSDLLWRCDFGQRLDAAARALSIGLTVRLVCEDRVL